MVNGDMIIQANNNKTFPIFVQDMFLRDSWKCIFHSLIDDSFFFLARTLHEARYEIYE